MVGLAAGVSVGVSVDTGVLVGVSVSTGVFAGVAVGVLVGVSVGTGVFVGVSVGTGVLVGVSVGTGVFVGVAVGVGVLVGVSVGVKVAVGAGLTTWSTGLLVLGLKFESPLYWAVIVWVPTVSALVVKLAVPPDRLIGGPILLLLSLNCTVPVGVPLPPFAGATLAVNVTGSPSVDGLLLDERLVEESLFDTMITLACAVP